MEQNKRARLPDWMKLSSRLDQDEKYKEVKKIVEDFKLHTICISGNCPNIGECWRAGTATFMILGEICTRSCKFCGVITGKPLAPDPEEPLRVARSIRTMKLKHAVITSVDRDDLPDRGAGFWADTILVIREMNPGLTMETLIPDFDGNPSLIDLIIAAKPDVISHNLETVRRLTPEIRTKARYDTSLSVVSMIAKSGQIAKSGIMLGLGETETEVIQTMEDLYLAGCSVLTLGQYLPPTRGHIEVKEWVTPEKFTEYQALGYTLGFKHVESHPLVRSSYHAEKHIR